jgi:hypothetical protein
MNKIKATKKEMSRNYKILGVGYCDMQYLLQYQKPIAYSCGILGWSCDYYNINGIIISTGYSYIASKNMKDDYNLIKEYDKKAKELNTANEINKLLFELLDKLEL